MPSHESLPYRPCAGMMVFNRDGHVFIDAALRHLPHVRRIDVFGAVRSPPDENESGTIEHHHAGARPIG